MTDNTLMNIAHIVAKESKCIRAKVGAVIVKNKRIIATGYNGTPSGTDNCCEENNVTKPEVIHAEINAILNATTHDLQGAQLYVTMSPCTVCAAHIVQKGITTVYYSKRYTGNHDGIPYLKRHNVLCIFLSQSNLEPIMFSNPKRNNKFDDFDKRFDSTFNKIKNTQIALGIFWALVGMVKILAIIYIAYLVYNYATMP